MDFVTSLPESVKSGLVAILVMVDRCTKNLRFKVSCPKLLPRWVGPFEIEKPIGKVAYKLHIPAKWRLHDVFHVSHLAHYRHVRYRAATSC